MLRATTVDSPFWPVLILNFSDFAGKLTPEIFLFKGSSRRSVSANPALIYQADPLANFIGFR